MSGRCSWRRGVVNRTLNSSSRQTTGGVEGHFFLAGEGGRRVTEQSALVLGSGREIADAQERIVFFLRLFFFRA